MAAWTGFGGVKISSTEFSTSWGKIRFDPVYVDNVTVGGKIKRHSKGFRPIIEVELINAASTDITKFTALASDISASQLANSAISIYPQYTSTDAGSQLFYQCFLTSSIEPEAIAQVDVGQTLKLTWAGRDLITQLPTNYSSQVEEGWIDDGSDTYIDENADTYNLF